MSQVALRHLLEKLPDAIVSSHSQHGDETAVIRSGHLLAAMTFLRDGEETKFEMLSDVTVVDYLGLKDPRFEVVYHLLSLTKGHRLRIKVEVEEEHARVPSVMGIWRSANWMEREAWDLYGITFEGHPDLRRILLYPEFKGHPLRKDYDMEARQPLIAPWPGRKHL